MLIPPADALSQGAVRRATTELARTNRLIDNPQEAEDVKRHVWEFLQEAGSVRAGEEATFEQASSPRSRASCAFVGRTPRGIDRAGIDRVVRACMNDCARGSHPRH